MIISPKRQHQAQTAWDEFFPYYAGYPDSFARTILSSARLHPRAIVLDPWNGSGTTTYVASQMGFPAIGMDLNPVMVIVARSRMLAASEADSLSPLATEILRRAGDEKVVHIESDPLLLWFDPETAAWLRSIETGIRSTLLGDLSLTPHGVNFDRVSSIAGTFYVALFNLAKSLAASFQSSNPTWLRKPKEDEAKASLPADDISHRFLAKVKGMADALIAKVDLLATEPAPVSARLFDSTASYGIKDAIDFVLTSPPYCTRIDYTAATRIQLAILSPLIGRTVDQLSRDMIGSIKVPHKPLEIRPEWGTKCLEFLTGVRTHSSHASGTYYIKTHVDYFSKMDRSLLNIASALKERGTAVMVVQDSHYKEIHNDVPSIIADLAGLHGLRLQRRDDFAVKSSMSGINPRARAYNKRSKVESVLCFQKAS